MLSKIQHKVVTELHNNRTYSLEDLCTFLKVDKGGMIKECTELHALGIVRLEEKESYEIKPVLNNYFQELPEKKLLDVLKEKQRIKKSELSDLIEPKYLGLGINELKKKNVILFDNDEVVLNTTTDACSAMESINKLNEKYQKNINCDILFIDVDLKDLEKRKILIIKPKKSYTISLLDESTLVNESIIEQVILTPEMIKNKTWNNKTFKKYNILIPSAEIYGGKQHPLRELSEKIRNIFVSMGYKEMDGALVENALYNFELLAIPQDHPAREMQDTLFLDNPKNSKSLPADLLKKAKQIHERYLNYSFDDNQAYTNLLRTHTTALTAHYLLNIQSVPAKFFNIGRVFRNETSDALHLPEFHQIEGVAIGDFNLSDLINTVADFYRQFGITDLKFKPTYNPYTEPSMEVYGFYPGLNKYVEIGNTGMFRPEMMECFGLQNHKSIAWGLALERLAGIIYKKDKIKDLLGDEVNLDYLRNREVKWL